MLEIPRLKDAYKKAVPGYERGITVPAIVDIPTGAVITNDFKQITLDLSTEWRELQRDGAPDLYPDHLRDEIDGIIEVVYRDVNNGVYEAGFAGTQPSYEEAYDRLFARLDELSERLEAQRFLVGDTITEADVRLFTTLARFDAVYHGHFKCNRQKLAEMPILWAYARDLSRPRASATPPTSSTSSGTTTRSIATSTRPASSRSDRTCGAGPNHTGASRSAADRSVTAPPPGPPPPAERVSPEHNPALASSP